MTDLSKISTEDLTSELAARGFWVERYDPYYHNSDIASSRFASNRADPDSFVQKRTCPWCKREVAAIAITRESYENWVADIYYVAPGSPEPTGFWLCSWWPSCGKKWEDRRC